MLWRPIKQTNSQSAELHICRIRTIESLPVSLSFDFKLPRVVERTWLTSTNAPANIYEKQRHGCAGTCFVKLHLRALLRCLDDSKERHSQRQHDVQVSCCIGAHDPRLHTNA